MGVEAVDIDLMNDIPTKQETDELTALALALATKSFPEWRTAAHAKYPNYATNPKDAAAVGAVLATAGVLAISTALIEMEPNIALRLVAFEEVAESVPTYLVASITIDEINKMVAEQKEVAALAADASAHPGFRD